MIHLRAGDSIQIGTDVDQTEYDAYCEKYHFVEDECMPDMTLTPAEISQATADLAERDSWNPQPLTVFDHRLLFGDDSKCVKELAYAPTDKVTEIVFVDASGARRVKWYAGMSAETFWRWTKAPSLGKFYNSTVKRKYTSINVSI